MTDPEVGPVPLGVVKPPKWPWILIGLVLLILTGTGGVFLGQRLAKPAMTPAQLVVVPSPTPDPTANWKTYSNSQYGFSFKYFQDMQVTGQGPAGDVDFLVSVSTSVPEVPIEFSVAIYKETSKSTLAALTNLAHDPNPISNPPIEEGEYAAVGINIIDGITANSFSSIKCLRSNRKCEVYLLSHGGYIYKIRIEDASSTTSTSTNQILSTFRFSN